MALKWDLKLIEKKFKKANRLLKHHYNLYNLNELIDQKLIGYKVSRKLLPIHLLNLMNTDTKNIPMYKNIFITLEINIYLPSYPIKNNLQIAASFANQLLN